MRDVSPGRYRPTNQDFDRMWEEGLFILDANVLLNLYRYSDETRGELVAVLHGIKERLWLPYQAANEFLTRRLDVIHQKRKDYEKLCEGLEEARDEVEDKMKRLHRDQVVEAEDLVKKVRRALDELLAHLEKRGEGLPDESNSPDDDEVWRILDELFLGRIGNPYSSERRKKLLEEGRRRYEDRVPPGYMDQDKDKGKDDRDGGERRFGDFLVWCQILDKAEQEKRPVVFVTDDRKEDWWWKSHGKTIGPRPELVEEARHKAGVLFHMYRPDRFMAEASERGLVEKAVSEEAIGEAKELASLEGDTIEPYGYWQTLEDDLNVRARRSQIDLLRVLAEELFGEDGITRLEARIGKPLEEISRTEADEWIDYLTPSFKASDDLRSPPRDEMVVKLVEILGRQGALANIRPELLVELINEMSEEDLQDLLRPGSPRLRPLLRELRILGAHER